MVVNKRKAESWMDLKKKSEFKDVYNLIENFMKNKKPRKY